MQRVTSGLVEDAMLKKATDWLFSRRVANRSYNGRKGSENDEALEGSSFLRSKQSLDSFGRAPVLTTDAYIIYALCRAGYGERVKDEVRLRQGSAPLSTAGSGKLKLLYRWRASLCAPPGRSEATPTSWPSLQAPFSVREGPPDAARPAHLLHAQLFLRLCFQFGGAASASKTPPSPIMSFIPLGIFRWLGRVGWLGRRVPSLSPQGPPSTWKPLPLPSSHGSMMRPASRLLLRLLSDGSPPSAGVDDLDRLRCALAVPKRLPVL